jgi:hypothetical protein
LRTASQGDLASFGSALHGELYRIEQAAANESTRNRGSAPGDWQGTVKLLGESREFGELAGEQGRFGLCGVLDVADVVPRLEGAGPLGAVLGCRHAVAGQEEEVVDRVVGGQEALNMPGRLEPLHLPFSSPCWLV